MITVNDSGDDFMKKLCALVISALVLSLWLCGCFDSAADTETSLVSSKDSVSEIGSEEVSSEATRISEEEAIAIAEKHWGIKSGDKDEETGFPFLIMPVDSGNDNIRIDLKWLGNGSTYSTVDWVEIDPVSGEIVSNP